MKLLLKLDVIVIVCVHMFVYWQSTKLMQYTKFNICLKNKV